jgi:hypothetical protein
MKVDTSIPIHKLEGDSLCDKKHITFRNVTDNPKLIEIELHDGIRLWVRLDQLNLAIENIKELI